MSERLLTPQQELFLANYTNPKSPTFSNALQSALKAGYAQQYAENITDLMPDWLWENIGDTKRLIKAEKVLDEMLDLDAQDSAEKKIKQDTAKFVAERLGKHKYSTKNETDITSGGEKINKIEINYHDSADKPVADQEASGSLPIVEKS